MAVTPNSIISPQKPNSGVGVIQLANNVYLNPLSANVVKIVQAGANGARVTKVRCVASATVVLTQIQEFRDIGTAGVTRAFSNSVIMPAYTLTQTTLPPIIDFGYSDANPKILQANEALWYASGVATFVTIEAEWADF